MTLPIIWADFPIQWIIPAVFLVIWALNQVFGREERAMPPGRREPLGPRVPGGPQRGPRPIPVRPDARRGNGNGNAPAPANRWPEQDLEPAGRREPISRAPRRSTDEEEVFMIPAESPRGSARNRQSGTGSGSSRRASRGRPSGGSPSSLRDVPPSQMVSTTQSLGASLLQSGSVTTTLGNLDAPNLDQPPLRSLGANVLKERGRAESIVSLVDRSSEELRRAIILGEILRPPLAMRKPGR